MKLKLLYLFAPHIFSLYNLFKIEEKLLQDKLQNNNYRIKSLDFLCFSPKYSIFEAQVSKNCIYFIIDIHSNLIVKPFRNLYIENFKDYYIIRTYETASNAFEEYREKIKIRK